MSKTAVILAGGVGTRLRPEKRRFGSILGTDFGIPLAVSIENNLVHRRNRLGKPNRPSDEGMSAHQLDILVLDTL